MNIYGADAISKIIKAAKSLKGISTSGARIVADNVFAKPSEIMEIIESISSVGLDIKLSAVPSMSWTHIIPSSCYVLYDASIAYWTMDSIINGSIQDSSSNSNNLSTNGTIVTGKFGGALQLDADKYCQGKIASRFPPRHFLFFSCWVYAEDFSNFPIVFCQDLFEIKTEDNYTVLKLYKDENEYTMTSNNNLINNSWNYIAVQFNGGEVFIAVNDTVTISSINIETLTNYCLDNDIYIGQDSQENKAVGLFDDIAISTECRIKAEFPCVKNAFSLKNDIAFWPLLLF